MSTPASEIERAPDLPSSKSVGGNQAFPFLPDTLIDDLRQLQFTEDEIAEVTQKIGKPANVNAIADKIHANRDGLQLVDKRLLFWVLTLAKGVNHFQPLPGVIEAIALYCPELSKSGISVEDFQQIMQESATSAYAPITGAKKNLEARFNNIRRQHVASMQTVGHPLVLDPSLPGVLVNDLQQLQYTEAEIAEIAQKINPGNPAFVGAIADKIHAHIGSLKLLDKALLLWVLTFSKGVTHLNRLPATIEAIAAYCPLLTELGVKTPYLQRITINKPLRAFEGAAESLRAAYDLALGVTTPEASSLPADELVESPQKRKHTPTQGEPEGKRLRQSEAIEVEYGSPLVPGIPTPSSMRFFDTNKGTGFVPGDSGVPLNLS
jgi:hypothetical protein